MNPTWDPFEAIDAEDWFADDDDDDDDGTETEY